MTQADPVPNALAAQHDPDDVEALELLSAAADYTNLGLQRSRFGPLGRMRSTADSER
jgi:hypothetical protein